MDVDIHQLKIAAAIAVLRSKPAGANARQYTEQLCAKYLQAQTQWRSRYLEAQDALVHLKQQLVLCSTQEVPAPADNACPPSPPSSTPDAGSTGHSLPKEASQQVLTSSCQFIHSVVSLTRAAQLEADKPSNQDQGTHSGDRHTTTPLHVANLDSLLTETIPTCVRQLRKVVSKGDTEVSTHCVMQGLDALVLLLNSDRTDCASGVDSLRLLLEHLGGLVDDLFQRLFEPWEDDIIQCVRTRRLLQQMLIHLTTKMRAPEKYSLLHSLATHAGTLCQIICSNTPVSPVHYECLAIALDCLQQGVISLKVGELHQESLRELQLEMESMLNSNLTREFPLVVGTILRLTSMIELRAKSAI